MKQQFTCEAERRKAFITKQYNSFSGLTLQKTVMLFYTAVKSCIAIIPMQWGDGTSSHARQCYRFSLMLDLSAAYTYILLACCCSILLKKVTYWIQASMWFPFLPPIWHRWRLAKSRTNTQYCHVRGKTEPSALCKLQVVIWGLQKAVGGLKERK